MSRQEIFQDIDQERDHQVSRWGNRSDDNQTAADFQQYINNQFCRGWSYTGDMRLSRRKALVNAAAIAVAAIESFDRGGTVITGPSA